MTAEISAKQVLCNPINFLAFGFGSGLSPILPGTCGTLIGIIIYLLLAQFAWPVYLGILIFLSLLGIWLCGASARQLNVTDYPGIVWDEMVGFLWVMFFAPTTWFSVLFGFLLFRLFDIWKPWPIRLLDEKVHGGLGIMLDDLLAAVYAWLVLQFMLIVV